MRDRSIDSMKGLLVLQMVLCHCIQFFGAETQLPQKYIRDYINLMTFSGFFFASGYVSWLAYYSKKFGDVWPKMARNAARCLIAFYISGICYTGLVEMDYFDPGVILQIITLEKYPGWSEFLASFFGIAVLGIILFPVFKKLNTGVAVVLSALSVAAAFLPCWDIHNPQAALFAGSYDYTTFPVIQYLIFYIFGVMSAKKRAGFKWQLALVTFFCSLPCMAYYYRYSDLPARFPPSWRWITGGLFFVYLYHGISKLKPVKLFENVGRKSLAWLLLSNIIIFAFAGSGFKVISFRFAIAFYVVLILGIAYLLCICGERSRNPKPQTMNK